MHTEKKLEIIKPFVDALKGKAKAICYIYENPRHFASKCISKPINHKSAENKLLTRKLNILNYSKKKQV